MDVDGGGAEVGVAVGEEGFAGVGVEDAGADEERVDDRNPGARVNEAQYRNTLDQAADEADFGASTCTPVFMVQGAHHLGTGHFFGQLDHLFVATRVAGDVRSRVTYIPCPFPCPLRKAAKAANCTGVRRAHSLEM